MAHFTRREMLAVPAAGAAASMIPIASAKAQSDATPDGTVPVFRYRLGEIEVFPIYDGMRGFPLQDGFVTNAPLEEVQAAFTQARRGTEQIENPFTATLFRIGGRLLLVDTGNGPQEGESPVGHLDVGLAAIGVSPEDIDTVVISHFHGDHISGLRRADGSPMFPNAETLVPEGEAAYWLDEGEMSRAPEGRRGGFERAQAIFAGEDLGMRTYTGGEELAPGMVAVDAHGHSPGHMAYRVQSGSDGLLLISDAAHLPFLFVANPDWSVRFDMDPEMARATRRRLLEEAAADRLMIAGYHWGFPNVGHVREAGTGFELVRIPWPG
ncbi:MBL fold metallo-hydrolase [Salinarimonas ramus]|uniref:MBL fold metallo-hydrolase n=1 Tax=Salinarimonas ramus TaxID=690164 RepID=A0A917V7F2_9HYPH|nr:MBL fold metallo-hydrolase [Salinarimonas ramus]GGK48753.1 MBL fold metallo-hydrolase [Salinarimonas ramus]